MRPPAPVLAALTDYLCLAVARHSPAVPFCGCSQPDRAIAVYLASCLTGTSKPLCLPSQEESQNITWQKPGSLPCMPVRDDCVMPNKGRCVLLGMLLPGSKCKLFRACRLARLGSQTMLQMMLVDNLIHSGAPHHILGRHTCHTLGICASACMRHVLAVQ